VNERSNETVHLGKKMVPDMSRIAVVDSNALHIHGDVWFGLCLSTQKCSLWEWQSIACKTRKNESTSTKVPNQKEILDHKKLNTNHV
jgi:hypothetical protein